MGGDDMEPDPPALSARDRSHLGPSNQRPSQLAKDDRGGHAASPFVGPLPGEDEPFPRRTQCQRDEQPLLPDRIPLEEDRRSRQPADLEPRGVRNERVRPRPARQHDRVQTEPEDATKRKPARLHHVENGYAGSLGGALRQHLAIDRFHDGSESSLRRDRTGRGSRRASDLTALLERREQGPEGRSGGVTARPRVAEPLLGEASEKGGVIGPRDTPAPALEIACERPDHGGERLGVFDLASGNGEAPPPPAGGRSLVLRLYAGPLLRRDADLGEV